MTERVGQVAVIFVSRRRGGAAGAPAGYAEAAALLETLAARQPGCRGPDGVRDIDGHGIKVRCRSDQAAAFSWRDQPDHARLRKAGRARWYDAYAITVACVERGYRWGAA